MVGEMEQLKHHELTKGERLRVLRWRRGLTQAEEAKRRGVGRTKYSRMENDRMPGDGLYLGRSEAFAIARHRSSPRLDLAGVARLLGVSRVTVLKWERLGNPKLVDFWNRRRGSTGLRMLA